MPKHVYEGTDPLTNKNASAPVGTGPFVFKEWVKGSHIILERNANYWDTGKPYLDRVVIRFITDKSARSAAFETGEIDVGGGPPVPQSDLARLQALPQLGSETKGSAPDDRRGRNCADKAGYCQGPPRSAAGGGCQAKTDTATTRKDANAAIGRYNEKSGCIRRTGSARTVTDTPPRRRCRPHGKTPGRPQGRTPRRSWRPLLQPMTVPFRTS